MNGQQSAVQLPAAPSDFVLGLGAAGSFLSGAAAAGLALSSPLEAGLSPALASALGASSLAARLRFLSPSFLKSVSYQPLPARRKAGAVRRRFTCEAPHAGQTDGSASDSFCRRSNVSLHALHSNS